MSLYESLREFFIKLFHEQGEIAILFFCKSTVARNVFLSKYKTMPQLNEMDADEKQKLKVYVNDLFKGETPQFRLEACKVIFTLNNCL